MQIGAQLWGKIQSMIQRTWGKSAINAVRQDKEIGRSDLIPNILAVWSKTLARNKIVSQRKFWSRNGDHLERIVQQLVICLNCSLKSNCIVLLTLLQLRFWMKILQSAREMDLLLELIRRYRRISKRLMFWHSICRWWVCRKQVALPLVQAHLTLIETYRMSMNTTSWSYWTEIRRILLRMGILTMNNKLSWRMEILTRSIHHVWQMAPLPQVHRNSQMALQHRPRQQLQPRQEPQPQQQHQQYYHLLHHFLHHPHHHHYQQPASLTHHILATPTFRL